MRLLAIGLLVTTHVAAGHMCLVSSLQITAACSAPLQSCSILLQEAQFPDINIICEKVAFDGVTRFEDRFRLPLGISVNMTAYTARLLTQVTHHLRVALPGHAIVPIGVFQGSLHLKRRMCLHHLRTQFLVFNICTLRTTKYATQVPLHH